MKILFVLKSENFLAPHGLCTISAVALKEGHKTYLCETNSQNPLKCINNLKPDMVAYSSSTGEAKHYLRLNQLIKERFPSVFTLMGGPHPTFFPEVIYEDNLDAVCIGEGEEAFSDLLSAIQSKNPVDDIPNIITKSNKDKFTPLESPAIYGGDDIDKILIPYPVRNKKQISNGAYRKGGVKTPSFLTGFTVRNLLEDLDKLPFPDYALLYANTPLGRYPLKSFITSRGCPYDCTYCFNHAWCKIYEGKGKVIRRHSVDYVIDEIGYIKEKWPLSCIKFYDDIFAYRIDDWLEEFSKKYKKLIDLPFFILTRADLLTEDMIKLLKYAGCYTISMSIEAGNPDIRNRMLRRHMSDEQIINAHRLCDKYRIYTFTNCIVGLPKATIDNEIESINLAIKAKVSWTEFPIFYPYPGTELGQKTIEMGFYKPDYVKMHTSYMHSSALNCFTKKEKNAQMNLTVLGPVAVVFPYFRNLILRYLIYMPHNLFFTLVYYFTKMYILRKKIYVTKATFGESLRIFARSLKQEWSRHENQEG